jgi:hypothetical protein
VSGHNFAQALDGMRVVQGCKQCAILREEFQNDIKGAVAIVYDLQQGIPPPDRDLHKLSEICTLVLKRAEFFCEVTADVTIEKPGCISFRQSRTLRGGEAVQQIFVDIKDKIEKNISGVSLIDLKPLRTYKWILSSHEKAVLQKWIVDVGKRGCKVSGQSKAMIKDVTDAGAIFADAVIGYDPIMASSAGASSSSSPAPRTSVSLKKAAADEEKNKNKLVAIKRFFNPKKKR